jgi:ketosteroid isomerase-like protein
MYYRYLCNWEVEVSETWAFAKYHVSVSGVPKGGGESFHMDRKYLDILQKQPDGSWKVHIHMWNDNPV